MMCRQVTDVGFPLAAPCASLSAPSVSVERAEASSPTRSCLPLLPPCFTHTQQVSCWPCGPPSVPSTQDALHSLQCSEAKPAAWFLLGKETDVWEWATLTSELCLSALYLGVALLRLALTGNLSSHWGRTVFWDFPVLNKRHRTHLVVTCMQRKELMERMAHQLL